MNLLLDNTFSTNHYISISEKMKKITMFFLYFNTIDRVKCLDEDFRKITDNGVSNHQHKYIKYKLLHFPNGCTSDTINCAFQSHKFGKCLYHIFYSANILHDNHLSFTIVHLHGESDKYKGDVVCNSPFVMHPDNSLPLLNDFSYSFYFPIIDLRNTSLFFSRSLLTNPYICIDVFLITYLVHLNIDVFTRDHMMYVFDLYTKDRPLNNVEMITSLLEYFIDYKKNDVVKYLLQFKYTWTYFSFCYFFVLYYPEQLQVNGLYEIFIKYIESSNVERNKNILKDIHNLLFDV